MYAYPILNQQQFSFQQKVQDRLAELGRWGLQLLGDHGRWGLFILRSFLGIFSAPYKLFPTIKEIRIIGVESLSIVVFTGLFTGMVLGLQGYTTLKRFGSEGILGQGVAVSLLSELGPVLTALLLTGRAGSSLCAEIGVMRISEQIDALECMAIDPFNYLISPKLSASVISTPILSFTFSLVGILGGFIAGVLILGVSAGSYYDGIVKAIDYKLIRMCMVKSIVFSIIMVTYCAHKGFCVYRQKTKGAMGVSKATTDAVVFTSVNVLLWDYLLTSILL